MLVLWAGSFSLASKLNPTPDALQMFRWYARAVIYTHWDIIVSITYKVYFMWWHVAKAMQLPAEPRKKMSDWIEKQH